MVKDLKELADKLDTNVKPLVEAIKNEDPTTPRYKELLENFTRMLIGIAAQAKKEKEEKANESNN